MNTPAVSIIIPTYNRLSLLREALDSIHRQTYRDFEVIVIDDGSTEEIASGVADHPVRPRVVRQQRQGPAGARNLGIEEASADLVAFLDSDDLWQPIKLERFIAATQAQPDINVFYGPMSPIDEAGNLVPGRTKPCHDGWITEKLFCSSFVHIPTVVCRKALLFQANCFDRTLPVCEDYDLWLRVSVREPFALIEEPCALRRLHRDRLSKACMSRNLAVKAKVLQRFFESNTANGHLDPTVAKARLARVLFAAARAAFRDGRYRQAVELCRESRRHGRSMLRTAPLMAGAHTLAYLPQPPEAGQAPT
ncbi:MAG: glycosyltransferase [Phycisphaerae bacterium]